VSGKVKGRVEGTNSNVWLRNADCAEDFDEAGGAVEPVTAIALIE
jgi:hypothetical protein